MMADDGWFYFGCGGGAGHYLFNALGSKVYADGRLRRLRDHFDGTLPPQPEAELYVASFSRLGGWNMSALSWWDRSVDKRPGSNSTVFAPGLVIDPRAMLDLAHARFPWVFNRLPRPLSLLHP